MRWMNLEPIKHSEVSKKEKNKYHVLTWNLCSMVLKNLFAGQQWRCRHRTGLWTQWRKERAGRIERGALKHMHYYMYNRWPVGICCIMQGAQTGALWQSRRVGGGGRWEGGSRGRRHMYVLCLVAQSCTTLCDPMDCSPPGSSVHGILQARILEWIAMPSSRGSSQSRDWTQVSHLVGGFFTIWATREAHEYWSG